MDTTERRTFTYQREAYLTAAELRTAGIDPARLELALLWCDTCGRAAFHVFGLCSRCNGEPFDRVLENTQAARRQAEGESEP